ncbi:MAG: PAS domain S-box protein, partial [Limisphaerales bacterium]
MEPATIPDSGSGAGSSVTEVRRKEALLKAGALQDAIFNSANFSSIATDARGVIQIFNVGAERMLGYAAADVMNKITPADISDPQEVVARAKALSVELGTPITPGFEALVFKASRGIEDIYELTYIRKDGSRFPAVVSVTALRDAEKVIIGYLLIGTDNTARQQVEEERKKLDQRLRDQQFYTRSLIESNIDAIMTTDPLGIITDVNKQMETLTGCTRDELIGAPFKNCFTDPELAEAGIKRVLNEKKVTDYELTARARDGRETVVSYNATTFYDRDRRLQGVFAAARDVTERKRFEQSLQEANRMKSEFLAKMSTHEQLRQLLAHSPAVIYTLKLDGTGDFPQVVSDNITLVLGFSVAETASPAWWLESLHPEDRERVLAVVTNGLKGDGYSTEYRIRHKDGTFRWMEDNTRVVRDAAGLPKELVGVWTEITERKRAEESLRQAEAKYRSIFDNAVEGISQVTSDGHLITANPALARMLGFGSVDKLLAGSLSLGRDVYVNPADRTAFLRLIEKNDVSNGFQCQFKRKDGQAIWVSLNGRTARDAKGLVQFYDITCEDITEGRKLEEQFRQSQKMEAVGQLAGGIAHDFNNILGAIIGNTELARADAQASPATLDCLEAIMQAGHRASDLVRQILAFSRRQEQQRQPMQLQFVVREALKLLRSTVPATIEIKTHLADTPTVLADPSQIHQVVMNLCTNAAQAMRGRPGVLKVELDEVEADAGFAQTHADLAPGHYVRLTVADTGCGMDRATQERIFEPFFTTKPPGEGTGLGLSVVHGIMKSHDGSVSVYSQPGEGTTFHLYFPVLNAEVAAPAAALAPVPRGHGEHVLFVDDELALVQLGRKVLDGLGYQVTTKSSASEAFAIVRDQPDYFDLVVTDLTMPGMSGADLARQ